MNIILNPDRTRKTAVSVDEEMARSPENPIDIIESDIFITDAPPIPDGMHTPQLLEDDVTWVEADTSAALARLRVDATATIDSTAGSTRKRWVSSGWGVELEYEQAESEAEQYLADVAANSGDPTGITVPESVQSAAAYISGTAVDGANDIINQASTMRGALNMIRAERLNGKQAVNSAVDQAGVEDAKAFAISLIRGIVPENAVALGLA